MVEYSIADISQITGIKAFTLRAWEKRYGIIEPLRTQTNIRKYSRGDLHKLLAISALVKNGFKISQVQGFSKEELRQKLGTVFVPGKVYVKTKELMKLSQIFDGVSFEKTLRHEIIELGVEDAVKKVILPFVQEAENHWIADESFLPQKNFAFDIIRRLIISESGKMDKPKREKILLFSPFEDSLELTLVITDYVLKKSGFEVVYCGQEIPIAMAKKAFDDSKASKVILAVSLTDSMKDISVVAENFMQQFIDSEKIILHKNCGEYVKNFPQIKFSSDIDDLKQYLNGGS